MNQDNRKRCMGICLVVILFAGILLVYSRAYGSKDFRSNSQVMSDNGIQTKTLQNIIERGYGTYQSVPESLCKLAKESLFCSETQMYQSLEEGEFVEGYEDEMTSKLCQNPAYLESDEFAQDYHEVSVSSEAGWGLSTTLEYDYNQGKFMNEDVIQAVESCGLEGFRQQLQKVEVSLSKEDKKFHFEHYIHCQGVKFRITKEDEYKLDEKAGFVLSAIINPSSCYAPKKYDDFVKGKMASGDYYLSSSCSGREKDVLTFTKNNSNGMKGYGYRDTVRESMEANNSKNISFIFKEGKVIDYYISTTNPRLKLDEKDQAMFAAEAEQIGKTITEKTKSMDGYDGDSFVYCAE